jgi:hypothetical protein
MAERPWMRKDAKNITQMKVVPGGKEISSASEDSCRLSWAID